MIIVLSPAKKLDFTTPASIVQHTQPDFLEHSQLLITLLRELSPVAIGKLMSLSDQLALLNVIRYADWTLPFSAHNAKQALLAFAGDVYTGLDAPSLSPAELNFAQIHLRILSGLYGVLRPLDLMQPYRLEMGTRLANPRGKDLYAFWGERIGDALNAALLANRSTVLVNLASEEYFNSVKAKNLALPVIQPVFEDWSAGKFKVVSFYAKRARGLMARFAIVGRMTLPEGLKQFSGDGYAYDAAVSTVQRWVFRRRRAE